MRLDAHCRGKNPEFPFGVYDTLGERHGNGVFDCFRLFYQPAQQKTFRQGPKTGRQSGGSVGGAWKRSLRNNLKTWPNFGETLPPEARRF
jgi:hypothetical protein